MSTQTVSWGLNILMFLIEIGKHIEVLILQI